MINSKIRLWRSLPIVFFIVCNTQRSYTQDNSAIIDLDLAVKLIVNKDSVSKPLRDSLQLVSNILINKLLNANSNPSFLYWSCLAEDVEIMKKLKFSNSSEKIHSEKQLRFIVEDFKLKSLFAHYSKAQLTSLMIFEMPVKVITRKLVHGKFILINGYKVYANPWIISDKKPAKIKFTNSTNPSSSQIIPLGRYRFWVESVTVPLKIHPSNADDFVDIGTDYKLKEQIIYIDVN